MRKQHRKVHEKLHDELERAAQPDEDPRVRQRNSGLAILVLALVVVGVLVALVMGGTDAFR
jgi:hypothetical protein